MPSTGRQIQLLLLPEDEDRVLRAIQSKHPGVKLLAYVPWVDRGAPPVRESVDECGTIATIWNPALHPRLPVDIGSDGAIVGPGIGPVVQWVRSLEKTPGILESGRWAAGFDKERDPEMANFVGSLWRVLNRFTTNRMVRTRGAGLNAAAVAPERRFRVGEMAAERALEGSLTLRSGAMYMRPEVA
ncbi:hypothetical protein AB0N14_17115 [Streptomyces sp. NPDC051104]|uniref:hypothetical protein n=1 Tax=Streptomyces sp. NPDC051104 TaxID=3155044 RepID=UPI00343EC9E1